MRLLVTGGAGFIGSTFVRSRLAQYPTDEVIVLDKLTYAADHPNEDMPAFHFAFEVTADGSVKQAEAR